MAGREEPTPIRAVFPDDVKDFISTNREGSYTLLDVRQPAEYEQGHLPGAMLIPLPQLTTSLDRLDPGKPTIVYCAVGGRSRMATQLLMHQGFQDVSTMEGGIQAWEERTATGPREFHLQFVRGDESPREVISIAYRMEEGLKRFHAAMRERTGDPRLSELLSDLIQAEESHERSLLELLRSVAQPHEDAGSLESTLQEGLLFEGGVDVDQFLEQNEPFLESVDGYLNLAMMLETQALDLYLRMASESVHPLTREVLHQIGDEEKAHLSLLGHAMEEHVTRLLP